MLLLALNIVYILHCQRHWANIMANITTVLRKWLFAKIITKQKTMLIDLMFILSKYIRNFFPSYIYVYRYVHIRFYVYMCIFYINLTQVNEAESIARQTAHYLNTMKEKKRKNRWCSLKWIFKIVSFFQIYSRFIIVFWFQRQRKPCNYWNSF